MTKDELLALIKHDFPATVLDERAAPHQCGECDAISAGLAGRTWREVPREFITDNFDVLPLLSRHAFKTYLAAWLTEAVLEPDQGVGTAILCNLGERPPTEEFSNKQASTILKTARFVAISSKWGLDEETKRSLYAIERTWST